jgi:hypothetical protein
MIVNNLKARRVETMYVLINDAGSLPVRSAVLDGEHVGWT